MADNDGADALESWVAQLVSEAAAAPESDLSAIAAAEQNYTQASAAADPAALIDALGQLLAARVDGLGARHVDTVMTAVALADQRRVRGDIAAVDLLRRSLDLVIEILGADHPSALAARHLVASYPDGADGSAAQRISVLLQLFADAQRVLGTDHPLTLATRQHLALLRREIGDRIGARDEAAALAETSGRALGDNHPDTLAARLTWALCLGEASDGATALAEINRLIPLLGAAFGYDHQNTLLARQTSLLWADGGDVLERVSEWEVLAEDMIRTLGDHHPMTVAAVESRRGQRASWLAYLDEYAEIAADVIVDLEIEKSGGQLDPDRPWADPGDLDEDGLAALEDGVAEERSEQADLMAGVVEAKREMGRTLRADGPYAVTHLTSRLDLAERLWRGHQFDSARARTEPLIADSVAHLGDDHSVTGAARNLLTAIGERRWA